MRNKSPQVIVNASMIKREIDKKAIIKGKEGDGMVVPRLSDA